MEAACVGSCFRIVALGVGVSALVWPAAWAAPVTDNLYPTIIAPGTEWCHNDPDGGDGRITCQTDNATVWWYMDSHGEYELETPDRDDVSAVNRREYDLGTNLDMRYDSSPVFSGAGETDIVYQEGSTNLDADVDGVTWCDDAVDGERYKCDQQYVRMRGNEVITQRLSCHETGHAIGFVHGQKAYPPLSNGDNRLGCMTTPVETSDLGSNQVENINREWDAP